MAGKKSKYSAEIQLGLLLIVLILLTLNVLTNYTLFKTRLDKQEAVLNELTRHLMSVSRQINLPDYMEDDEFIASYKQRWGLSEVIILPGDPFVEEKTDRRAWLSEHIHHLPLNRLPDLVQMILDSDFYTLNRGPDNQFFVIYPRQFKLRTRLCIIAKEVPELAYLEDTGKTIFTISVFALGLLVFVYFRLYRFILKPYQTMRSRAVAAGRSLEGEADDVELLIEDYQQIIDELTEKEKKLLEMNEDISSRADSLKEYNDFLLDSMVSGIVTVDDSGRIISINQAAEQILSCNEADLSGNAVAEIRGLPGEITCPSLDNQPIEPRKYQEYDVSLNGDIRTLAITISPIIDNSQHQLGVSILLHDLTETSRLRKELEKTNQLAALGEMSAGLAHQLRNSLGAVSGFTRLLQKRNSPDPKATEMIHDMASELKEAEQMIAKFLSFTRPFEYAPEKIEINTWLNRLFQQFQKNVHSIPVTLNHQIPEDISGHCLIDAVLLKQAITNVLDNAAQALSSSGGEIHLSLFFDDTQAIIKITDTGRGMDETTLRNIFTPFFSTNPAGTGLGLSLVKKIISLHGGSIDVSSELEKGTTVSISIPVSTQTSYQPTM